MKLSVHVLEAKDLPLPGTASASGSYVKVRVGNSKSRTRLLWNDPNPKWNEEFVFTADDPATEVVFSVYCRDEDGRRFFGSSGDDLAGRVKVPILSFARGDEERAPVMMMPPRGLPSRGRLRRSSFARTVVSNSFRFIVVYGKILLSLSLHCEGEVHKSSAADVCEDRDLLDSRKGTGCKTRDGKEMVKAITRRIEKIFVKDVRASGTDESLELSGTPSENDDSTDECSSTSHSFEEAIGMMQSRDSGKELPDNLDRGVLVDQLYAAR
ncbi:hypothetical protein MLD38_039423 [Melastoma candidum]|uniref:Uncharacterized protein n=1 Tax=Melastoma candidum TaxID=119954 RepID=A0ACB9L204_9MYRT|nr:hypothetical protein MLD38_039423 [Melastoma candidum]